MIIAPVTELSLMKVFDRGEPNKECIGLVVNETVELGQFAMLLGALGSHGMATPYPDNFFWFGDVVVNQGDWIFVYTGPGTPRLVKATNGTNDIYTLFWNKPKTILARSTVLPVLIKIGEVQIMEVATDVPQGGPAVALNNS